MESTLCILSVDRKRGASKFNVGVVLIIAIREISNRENEFYVNSRNIRPSKITRYTVLVNGFSVTCYNNNYIIINFFRRVFLRVKLKRALRDLYH